MSVRAFPLEELEKIARSDDQDQLAEMMRAGLNLDRTDDGLLTPLAVVAQHDAPACTRLLIERGAAVNAGDPSPVHAAIEADQLAALEILLAAGAESGGLEDDDPDYPAPLVVAVERGNVGAVEMLLAHDSLERSSRAVIEAALRQGLQLRGKKKLGVLRPFALGLFNSGTEVIHGSGPLLRALKFLTGAAKRAGDELLASAVSGLKARLDEAKAELEEAEDAFQESRFEQLFGLIERVPAARQPGVLGIVAGSATTGCYVFTEWMLEKGAVAHLSDETGKTPLMHVASHGSENLVQPLLARGDGCLNARDDGGKTALELLAARHNFPFAHVIEGDLTYPLNIRRDQGASPVRIDEAPEVAAHAYRLMQDRQLRELSELLREGNLEEAEWKLAAGGAVLADCANSCMTLLEYCLDRGADPNARKDRGSNVLHGACEVHQTPLHILRRIVESGADLEVVDRFGRSVADNVRRTWPEGHECREYMESVLA